MFKKILISLLTIVSLSHTADFISSSDTTWSYHLRVIQTTEVY